MRRSPSVRWTAAALFAAASVFSVLPAAAAAQGPPTSGSPSWPSGGRVHTYTTLPDRALESDEGRALRAVFVLPDEAWDTRRAWPYLDRLLSLGVAVVELRPDDDGPVGLSEAHAAIAAASEELGLHPSRIALLGFGTGGRVALALAGPDGPAVALYPVCGGAPVPDAGAWVLVLHPDEASEARACAALLSGRPRARSAPASTGAGHGWDVVRERGGGSILLPHPDDAGTWGHRMTAHPDKGATFRAAQSVSGFLLTDRARGGEEGEGQ